MDSKDRNDTRFVGTARLEAFTDSVLAIVITIMVIELHAPAGHDISDWKAAIPSIVAYALSFIFIAIYWNNHHHLLRATQWVTGGIMWANMHLLFWLSLVPRVTAWVGEGTNYRHTWPVVLYGSVAFMAAAAYAIMVRRIEKAEPGNKVARQIGKDIKGKLSNALYGLGIVLALVGVPLLGILSYVAVSVMWLIPDRRLYPA